MKLFKYSVFVATCMHMVVAHAASITTTSNITPATATVASPTTGYAVTDTSTANTLSFTAISSAESSSDGGIGTISSLSIQVTGLATGETLTGTTLSLNSGAFDDGLIIIVSGITIVDFNYNNYDGVTAVNDRYDLDSNGGWTPWSNEGNPELVINFQTNTVQLLVDDQLAGSRTDILNHMIGTPRPNSIPTLNFMTGVTIGSAFNNAGGPGSISAQNLTFSATVTTLPIGASINLNRSKPLIYAE